MYDLSKHPYFEPWYDRQAGIVSDVLSERTAPAQRSIEGDTRELGATGVHTK